MNWLSELAFLLDQHAEVIFLPIVKFDFPRWALIFFVLAIAGVIVIGGAAQRPLISIVAVSAVPGIFILVLMTEFALAWLASGHGGKQRISLAHLLRAFLQEASFFPKAFFWDQALRRDLWPDCDAPLQCGQRGVVFVHGMCSNRGVWNAWLKRLTNAGNRPFIAVDLALTGVSIGEHYETIDAAVRKLQLSTELCPIIVAHSMGGLAVRSWWACPGNTERLLCLVTLGTPHGGTWMAKLSLSAVGRQMRMHSDWLCELMSNEPAENRARTACFYSDSDNIVFPATCATLPGAKVFHLKGLPHLSMVNHALPWTVVTALLEAPDPIALLDTL